MKLNSSWAWLISVVLVSAAFIWHSFYPDSALSLYLTTMAGLGVVYGFKRHQKNLLGKE